MASANVKKLNKQNLAGLKVHFDQDKREELNHANKHIDKELSHLNYTIGCDSWDDCMSKLKARVAAVDAVNPPGNNRKDRVIGLGIEVTCPPEIEAMGMDAVKEYFEKVHSVLCDYLGADNVFGGFVHLDEKHSYVDAETKENRESAYHAHFFGTPYVDKVITKTDKKTKTKTQEHFQGINGKYWGAKPKYDELHKRLEDMGKEMGIQWHTGRGSNTETVEQLKAKSAKAEREIAERELLKIQRQKDAVSRQLSDKEKQLEDVTSQLSTVSVALGAAKEQLEEVKEEVETMTDIISEPLPETPPISLGGKISKKDYDALYRVAEINRNAAYNARDGERIAKQAQAAMTIENNKLKEDNKALQNKVEFLENEKAGLKGFIKSLYDKVIATDFRDGKALYNLVCDISKEIKDCWNTIKTEQGKRTTKDSKMLSREIEDPER